MRILITGHDGYIGAVMGKLFEAAGHEVHGLDTGWFRHCVFGGEPPRVEEWMVDVRDADESEFSGRFRGFDALLHLAALSNDPLGALSPDSTHEINHRASVHMARLAKRAGIQRFVFSSSCSLYGAADGATELDESAPMCPVTAYGETKILAEREIAQLADASFSPTFLRNATAYGISPRLRTDLVVNDLVGHAVTSGEVLLKSDGTPWRPLVHVEDIGRAFLAVAQAPRESVHNEVFNIGRPGENYQVRQIAELVTEIVPGSRVTFAAGAAPDRRNYRVDFSKAAHRLPGFEPRWTLRRGIEEVYAAFRQHLSPELFGSSRYVRLPQLHGLRAAGALDATLRWCPQPDAPSRVRDRSATTLESAEESAS